MEEPVTQQSARAALAGFLMATVPGPVEPADLQPRTAAAFDRYAAATERRISSELDAPAFIHVDRLTPAARQDALADLRQGRLFIERLATRENGRDVDIPGGLVHHWVALVFAPGATVDEAVSLLQDYDRAAEIYDPAIARSRVLAREGDRFSVYLRFFMKKVITVVLDTEHDARFFRPSADRAHSRIVSTRVAEVEDPGTARERQKPEGEDGGYLWRLNTYWRFLERDGGVYVQCESLTLTRRIPPGLGWLIGPFVTSIPRESLTFTMETTRRALTQPAP
jgi:hypothetical protein